MDLEKLREYCLSKKGTSEGFPFDEETLVFKVLDKLFCLTSFSTPLSMNLKCEPEMAIELREKYDCVQPGYHMNKKHWNTVTVDGSLKTSELEEMIDNSYNLIVENLTKKKKEELSKL